MIIRNFNEDIFLETARMCRQNMELDRIPDFLFREKTFGDFNFNPELTLVTLDDYNNKVIGFIQGVVRERKDGNVGYIKLLCVDSNFRRRGIARELYTHVENSFRENKIQLIRIYESYPNYYMPGVDPFYTEAIAFFERLGFKKFNDTSNLIVDLSVNNFSTEEDIEKLKSNEIICYRPSKEEREEVLNWVEKSFYGWIPEVSRAFENNPISLFCAKMNDEVLAFSAYEVNNIGTGWFGPMGTDDKLRGKGVGGVLLKLCLNEMKQLGFTKAIIPWVGPIPFYMFYANAKVQRVFWRYEKKLE
jgi:ribosomal protein S18 acetylase RimI-like enzyme